MPLSELRKKVIYQNSIDIWISLCEEKNIEWGKTDNYKKFIAYLTKNNLNMKKFPMCVKESDEMYENALNRTKFAEALSESEDPNTDTYTIKLNDSTMELLLKFEV